MCCGGGGRRAIRSSTVVDKIRPSKTVSVQRVTRSKGSQPVNTIRQYKIPRTLCSRCQSPTMLVHIAGRERQQCTNVDCRFIVK